MDNCVIKYWCAMGDSASFIENCPTLGWLSVYLDGEARGRVAIGHVRSKMEEMINRFFGRDLP